MTRQTENPSSPPPSLSRGRPRDHARTRAILGAAFKLTKRLGIESVTVSAIAKSAGVSTATLYRRWASKEAIVMEAYLHHVHTRLPVAESGLPAIARLRGEVLAAVDAVSGSEGRLLASLIACTHRNSSMRDEFLRRFLDPRRDEVHALLRCAIAEGDLPPDLQMGRFLDAIYAPIYYGIVVAHSPIGMEQMEYHLDLIFAGVLGGRRTAREHDR